MCVLSGHAFSPDTYARESVMAKGTWVKVSVAQTGMHMISRSDLQAWGFTDPSKVRVYGYGGRRISDRLELDSYHDDLPVVQSVLTSRGLIFYAVGSRSRTYDNGKSVPYYPVNPYSDYGYYFLSDRDGVDGRPMPVEEATATDGTATTSFSETVWHESDLISPAQSGHCIVGEDLRFTPTRKFSFQLPDNIGDNVSMRCAVYAKSSGGLQLTFSADGSTLTPSTSDRVPGTTEWGALGVIYNTVPCSGNKLDLTITASPIGTLEKAYLDNIFITYQRALSMPSQRRLEFSLSTPQARIAGATSSTHVWDVTDPLNIIEMRHAATADGVQWRNPYQGTRDYAAWDENATFLTPKVVAKPACQNLHGQPVPDMVIFTHPTLRTQAERIAALHAGGTDSMRVLVVIPEHVYNEFSSGTPDIQAMRRLLKMFYDRGTDAAGHSLKYALLMGSANYDHRRVTAAWQRNSQATMPIWQTDNGNSENDSFSSDDMLALLEDNSGLNMASANACIGVGRIPAHTADEAKVFVDRLISYVKSPQTGLWRNRMTLVADDGYNSIHMKQTEEMEQNFRTFARGRDMTFHKVYVDTYDKTAGVVRPSREKLHNLLKEGTLWWNYVGHSSIDTNSNEGILTMQDLSNLYLRRPPFYYGATCSFVHWDGDESSGLERLALTEAGGVVGGISAIRPVYISRNGVLTSALGKELFDTDPQGRIRPIGEVLRRAKNRIGSDSNKLRYVLLGDPAMRLAIPDNVVTLDSINSRPVLPDDGVSDPVVITALGHNRLSGAIRDAQGRVMETFNGHVDLMLYDAEKSFTTKGRDSDDPYIYDEQGDQLYAGRTTVTAGRWELSLILPPEIADNFRNATLTMFAQTADNALAASGVNRDFYVYGYDENSIVDDRPPVIEWLYLNHESFSPGDAVNTSPMLMAHVRDDQGLNMSMGGIGHQMAVRIDNSTNFSDVSASFTPDADGSPAGEIIYQLPDLEAGPHTATLKIWDIGGNSTTASIDFTVDPSQAPKIFDVYTDTNAADMQANFYIAHNRPDAMLTVQIDVYDLSGRLLWSDNTRGRADMYVSAPVTWNLTDNAGHRVPRGIYVYRATVMSEASGDIPATSASIAKRLAVRSL